MKPVQRPVWHYCSISSTVTQWDAVLCCCSLGGQVLQIPRVQLEDAGKYTCQAVNEAGEDRMHFDLDVLGWHVFLLLPVILSTHFSAIA